MNANPDLERRLADFYASEAPLRAPDWVLESVLAISEITRQRRALIRLPRRVPRHEQLRQGGDAAVAVIAIGAVGLAVLRGGAHPVGVFSARPRRPPARPVRRSAESFTSSVRDFGLVPG